MTYNEFLTFERGGMIARVRNDWSQGPQSMSWWLKQHRGNGYHLDNFLKSKMKIPESTKKVLERSKPLQRLLNWIYYGSTCTQSRG